MDNDEIFLTYYKIKKDKTLLETTYTRKDFFQLVTLLNDYAKYK